MGMEPGAEAFSRQVGDCRRGQEHGRYGDRQGAGVCPLTQLFTSPLCVQQHLLHHIGERFEYQDEKFLHLLTLIDTNAHLLSNPSTQLYNVFPKLLDLLPGPHKRVFKNVKDFENFFSTIIDNHKDTLKIDSPRDFIDAFLIKMKQVIIAVFGMQNTLL
ncbi:CP2F2 protein, partial [Polypterus senegalus]